MLDAGTYSELAKFPTSLGMERDRRRIRVLLVDESGPPPGGLDDLAGGNAPFDIDHVAYDRDVLERLAQGRPDVVLVDWRIPEGKRLEVIRRARRANRAVPIILMAGEARTAVASAALAAGATTCLAKPLTPEKLAARLAHPPGPVAR